MKKTIVLMLIAVFCFVLISCGEDKDSDVSTNNLKKTISIVSNNNRNTLTTEDEEFIYFFDMPSVKKMSKTDNTVEDVYTFEDIYTIVDAIECFEDRLYLLTYEGKLISMDKNGDNLLEVTFPLDETSQSFGDAAYIPTPYIFGENLYLISGNSETVYRVIPETLVLEAADLTIVNQHMTPDKRIFTQKVENEEGKLYMTPNNGEEVLFSDENELVNLSRINITDYYVFYMAFDAKNFNSVFLYRVNLDGENKVLIKEFQIGENNAHIQYDNEYIYLSVSDDEYLKINKETLKETNIDSVVDTLSGSYEISNGKIFQYGKTYCIDSETGEKIAF